MIKQDLIFIIRVQIAHTEVEEGYNTLNLRILFHLKVLTCLDIKMNVKKVEVVGVDRFRRRPGCLLTQTHESRINYSRNNSNPLGHSVSNFSLASRYNREKDFLIHVDLLNSMGHESRIALRSISQPVSWPEKFRSTISAV